MKKFLMCSENPAKIKAAQKVLRLLYGDNYSLATISVKSGVNATPMSDDEGIKGAAQRIDFTQKTSPNYDVYIGLEGIISTNTYGSFLCGWAVVKLASGKTGYGCSAKIKLPDELTTNFSKSEQLSDRVKKLYPVFNDKISTIGTNGILTNNLYTRIDEFEDALTCAFASVIDGPLKVFLASYAKDTLSKIIAQLNIKTTGKRAVFIPTAGDPYDNKDFVDVERDRLEELGFTVADLDLKICGKQTIKKALSQADLVLVAGGNTFYLLNWARKSGFDKLIKKFILGGGVYVGSSAGSILLCPTIEGATEFDNLLDAPGLTNFNGLNIFPNIIVPHADKEKYFERIERVNKKLGKIYKVMPITDDQVVLFDGLNSYVID